MGACRPGVPRASAGVRPVEARDGGAARQDVPGPPTKPGLGGRACAFLRWLPPSSARTARPFLPEGRVGSASPTMALPSQLAGPCPQGGATALGVGVRSRAQGIAGPFLNKLRAVCALFDASQTSSAPVRILLERQWLGCIGGKYRQLDRALNLHLYRYQYFP